jgi:hypothetical protein
MPRVAKFYRSIERNPFAILEFIFGLALIMDGFYLLLPGYEPAPSSVFIEFVATPIVAMLLAIFYIVTGAVSSCVAFGNSLRWRSASALMLFAAFFFTVLIRWLTVGLVPTVWLWPLLLSVVAAVDYWNIQWNRRSP